MILFIISKICNYLKNIYPLNFLCEKKNENDISKEVYYFLKNISKNWKNNEIKDLDLICDIIYIYNKYNLTNIEDVSNKIENDIHMKYYILGWYMYQNAEKKINL